MRTKQTVRTKFGTKALALFAAAALCGMAQASSYDFTNITHNGNADLSKQLSLNVTQVGSNQALFTISNRAGGTGSSIDAVYFDQGSSDFFSDTTITRKSVVSGIAFDAAASSYGVKFADGGSSTLPGGKSVSFTADDWSHAVQPAPTKGVNPGEWAGFLGTFVHGDFRQLIAALDRNDFRVGLHVISIASQSGSDCYTRQSGSDSYVSTVPLPAAAWLFGSALIGFVTISNRRKV